MTQTISQAVSALAALILAGLGIWGAIELNPWFQLQQTKENLAMAQIQVKAAKENLEAVQQKTRQLTARNSELESEREALEREKGRLEKVTDLALSEISERDEELAKASERSRNLALENDRLRVRFGARRGAVWIYVCSIYSDAVASSAGTTGIDILSGSSSTTAESGKYFKFGGLPPRYFYGPGSNIAAWMGIPGVSDRFTLGDAFTTSERVIPVQALGSDFELFKSSLDAFVTEHESDMTVELIIRQSEETGASDDNDWEELEAAFVARLQKAAQVIDSYRQGCLEANPGSSS